MQKFIHCQSFYKNVKYVLVSNSGFHLLKLHYLMPIQLNYKLRLAIVMFERTISCTVIFLSFYHLCLNGDGGFLTIHTIWNTWMWRKTSIKSKTILSSVLSCTCFACNTLTSSGVLNFQVLWIWDYNCRPNACWLGTCWLQSWTSAGQWWGFMGIWWI